MSSGASVSLDPSVALVLIDLQRGIVTGPKAQPVEAIVANAARLAVAFRARNLPVVLVNVAGGAPGRTERGLSGGARPEGFADLVPELDPQPSDIRITKKRWGAFSEPSLHPTLQALGVTQIVLGGIATSIGVESTARVAYELGYNVTLVTDAMTDFSAEAHENSLERVFPRLGERATTDEVVAALAAAPGDEVGPTNGPRPDPNAVP